MAQKFNRWPKKEIAIMEKKHEYMEIGEFLKRYFPNDEDGMWYGFAILYLKPIEIDGVIYVDVTEYKR